MICTCGQHMKVVTDAYGRPRLYRVSPIDPNPEARRVEGIDLPMREFGAFVCTNCGHVSFYADADDRYPADTFAPIKPGT